MAHEYTMIVYTRPAEGREAEYNAWYDDVHLPEFSALPGVISGRRFQVTGPAPDGAPSYAAIYELSDHPDQVMAAMGAGVKDGVIHMSDALDSASVQVVALKPR